MKIFANVRKIIWSHWPEPEMGNGTWIPLDTNPGTWDWDWDLFSWYTWDWDKYRWDSPGTKISGTAKSQALGPLGTLVPWDF